MDLFFAYMLVASATPLFLWLEHRKIAFMSIPFILIMWGLFASFLMEFTPQTTFVVAFLLNVLIAHVAAFLLYTYPYLQKRKVRTTIRSK
ncbi:spore morphogenesis/germination protein YwcE [Shouchella lonarensis]|uniref:Holin, BSH family n=1 Tax=Shouchella lonarensis TaxID=1464122 RepID=A0A1G6HBZ6_9BACI|nr:spore morphogenesis/germination protein YwcE [Shouchella lonarensis]SDB91827.1 holin, BSH family [Shouchella lonarensis]